MWFIPVCAFPAFVHMLLIWTVGALCSKVSGSPSEVLYILEGPGKDGSGEASHSSKRLGLSVVLGKGVRFSPRITCNFFLEPLDI